LVTAFSGPTSDRTVQRVAALVLSVFVSSPAYADKQKALEHFEKGTTAYNLGRFEEAIDWYEKAYEEHNAPAFLFNLAQSHRQLGNCERAAFFYRRFLSEDPDTEAKAEVEARIVEQDQRCSEKAEPPPPPPPPPPPVPRRRAPPPPPPRVEVVIDNDPLFVSTAEIGVAYVTFGDLTSATSFRARLGAALPFRFGRLWLEPGISGAITPVGFQADSEGTSILSEVYGNVTAAVAIHERFRIRLELGAGVLVLSGLKAGNPYTVDGAAASGPLSMFSFQAGVGTDFAITDAFSIGVTPFVFSLSPPKAGLRAEIDRIQRISATAGISLRL
jgi:hypothetical protein